MKMKKLVTKHAAMILGITSVLFFSGCVHEQSEPENDNISSPQESKMSQEDFEKAFKEYLKNNPVEFEKEGDKSEISQEDFEKAFKEYLKNKPVEFGKEVDNAYKKYQEELQKEASAGKLEKAKSVPPIVESDHVLGNKDANFILFEYSDYHCPFCKRFHPTTKEFLGNHDDVAIVLRAYPGVHRNTSAPLHELAECIAKEEGNDAFWKFSDLAFEKGSALTIKNASQEFAGLGITKTEKIMQCYNSGEFKDIVNSREQEAQEMGILGTPGSILKNMTTGEVRLVEGAYPLEALEQYKKELE